MKVCLLDWQCCRLASPVNDLVYYFGICTDKALRDKHYIDLTTIYYDTIEEVIRKCGSDPDYLFNRNDFTYQVAKYGKWGLLMGPIASEMMVSTPENIVNMDDVAVQLAENKNFNNEMVKLTDKTELLYIKRLNDHIADAIQYNWVD